MKTISVRDLQKEIRKSVDEAQKDRVVVTRNGNKEKTISLREMRRRLKS